jgi:hypothetical protein
MRAVKSADRVLTLFELLGSGNRQMPHTDIASFLGIVDFFRKSTPAATDDALLPGASQPAKGRWQGARGRRRRIVAGHRPHSFGRDL